MKMSSSLPKILEKGINVFISNSQIITIKTYYEKSTIFKQMWRKIIENDLSEGNWDLIKASIFHETEKKNSLASLFSNQVWYLNQEWLRKDLEKQFFYSLIAKSVYSVFRVLKLKLSKRRKMIIFGSLLTFFGGNSLKLL